MASADPFLTIAEAAEQLRVSDESIRRAIRRGSLTAFADGRIVRIRQSALDAYIEAGTQRGPRPGRRRG